MAINDETLRLARAMRISIDSEVDASTRILVRAWARAWDELNTTWSEAMMDLAATSTDGTWPTSWEVARSQRAQAALAAATDQIHDLSILTGVTVTDAVGRVVDATPEFEAHQALSQLPAVAGDRVELLARFNRLDELALNAIVERTREQITAATWRLEYGAQDAMRRALVQGVAVGDNPRRIAREMVRRAEGSFNGGLTRAMTIARTEALDAHRMAARGWRVTSEDLVTGWQWMATLDTRTCPSCWGMHGTEWDIAATGPDDHQQGRCVGIPLTRSWRDLGFAIDEPPSVMPDAQATFDALPAAAKLEVMGPARLEALASGRVSLRDMATQRSTSGWRDSWAPTPVRALPAA